MDAPRHRVRTRSIGVPLLAVTLLSGCTLPRVAILSDPLTATEHVNLGVSYENEGRYDLARREYRAALKDGHPKARLYLGNAYFSEGHYEEAAQAYRKAVEAHPDDPAAFNNLAWVYHEQGRNDAVTERLAARAVALEPGNPSFSNTLASVREARGQRDGGGVKPQQTTPEGRRP